MANPIQDPVAQFVVHELIRDDIQLEPDEPIFSAGLLGSLSVLPLMRFLEDTFAIRIEVADVTLADFDSLARIEALVTRLRSRPAAG